MIKKAAGNHDSVKEQRSALILVAVSLLCTLAILNACQQAPSPEPADQPRTTRTAVALEPFARSSSAPGTSVTRSPTVEPAANETSGAERPAVQADADAVTPSVATGAAASPDAPGVHPATAVVPENEGLAGALIAVKMDGRAGVLLDELPEEVRDRVAESLIGRPESFWIDLARRQVRLIQRRLNFRNFVYEDKGQLPLPPEELWSIRLDPAGPSRRMIRNDPVGHDLVVVDYTFTSTLLTDADSPAAAEPALSATGGRWSEPFVLPVDPDLLLQRTGNTCLNEAGFPPNSFDSENAWIFFDYSCEADSGGLLGCHRTQLPNLSCLEALTYRPGFIETEVQFERLAWNPDLAESVRVGDVTHADGPDLDVIGDDLEKYRIIYRYFPADSCALVEGCVGGSGWRRLLQFNATVHNVGAEPLHIGPVISENPVHNLFQYNTCHNHFHFSDYGEFSLSEVEEMISSKQAFCVESTNRFSNNEASPLTHPYSCSFQGVQSGWVDEYVAGLDCQWIDITDLDIPAEPSTVSLGFTSNPNQFLCEGSLLRDDLGNPLWEPSGLTTPDGISIQRPQCDFVSDWDANNRQEREIPLLAAGSFVTEPCEGPDNGGQLGPRRNCGFSEVLGAAVTPAAESGVTGATPRRPETSAAGSGLACAPGRPVQLSCSLEDGGAPQVLRICDYSEELGTGVACTYLDALANRIVGQEETQVDFTCPVGRGGEEQGGSYSLYQAPVFSEDDPAPISCIVSQ